MPKPIGVHLVGSVPLKSEEQVFSKACHELRDRLYSIPDGETGIRDFFAYWQKSMFPDEIHGPLFRDFEPSADQVFRLSSDSIRPTQYNVAAIASYKKFCDMRDLGIIPKGIRFQVCLPGVLSVIYSHVDLKYMAQAIPIYEQRLIHDLHQLQEFIPAEDLAIQFDLAFEFAIIEYSRGNFEFPLVQPYWSNNGDVLLDVLKRVTLSAREVKSEIPMGFHLCYGDMEHKHFMEPRNAGLLVEFANGLNKQLAETRSISWIHMPVPKGRTDTAYYEPLKQLALGSDTKLYLGLVHAQDKDGTLERIKTAQSVYDNPFGVATECGMGRTPVNEIDSIFEICAEVAAPST
ncbi:hypothetical protein MMC10_002190 [Thelotrema lepadinum]|nr:hypothetical protein [Thelotrema lepadinum]